MLCQHLRQAAAHVGVHTILLGMGGTFYSPYSMEPLLNLGLDPQKTTKLVKKPHALSVRVCSEIRKYQTRFRENLCDLSSLRSGMGHC